VSSTYKALSNNKVVVTVFTIIIIIILLDILILFIFYNQKGQERRERYHKKGKYHICHRDNQKEFSKNKRLLLKGLQAQAIILISPKSTTKKYFVSYLIFKAGCGFVDHYKFYAFLGNIKRRSKWKLEIVRITWTVTEEKQVMPSKTLAMRANVRVWIKLSCGF
jgi:hypothetical protein